MKNIALILSAVLCAGAFAQTYPADITGKADWAAINAEGSYADFSVDGGSIEITENSFNSGKNILLTDNGGSILVGGVSFTADNFSFSGSGALAIEGFGDQGVSAFSLNENSSVAVKSATVKKLAVEFNEGSKMTFGAQGVDGSIALAISDSGSVTMRGQIEIDVAAYRESLGGSKFGYWDLATVDTTSSFTFDESQSVVMSDAGEFQLQSVSGSTYTYMLKTNGEEWSLIAVNGAGADGQGALILAVTVPEASHVAALFGAAALAFAAGRRRR